MIDTYYIYKSTCYRKVKIALDLKAFTYWFYAHCPLIFYVLYYDHINDASLRHDCEEIFKSSHF